MSKIRIYKTSSIKTKFGKNVVYTQQMQVKDVVKLHYVAVRGRDKEEGAIQRPLNKKRILDIKNYVLQGRTFFNTFILNWTNIKHELRFIDGSIQIPIVEDSAQVIDGQHRLAGLSDAIKEKPSIGTKLILVTIAENLSTEKAAEIFLNINSEQKPVPKSLIYDLFGIVEKNKEHSIVRAKDISDALHNKDDSPYKNLIKYPGSPSGVIGLSTVVSTLKKQLDSESSLFYKYNITNFETQQTIILNFYNAIKFYYDKKGWWFDKAKNPFLKSAGFIGAFECFIDSLFVKCIERKSFSQQTFKDILRLDEVGLILQSEIKGMDGKSARIKIKEHLSSFLTLELPDQNEYDL